MYKKKSVTVKALKDNIELVDKSGKILCSVKSKRFKTASQGYKRAVVDLLLSDTINKENSKAQLQEALKSKGGNNNKWTIMN